MGYLLQTGPLGRARPLVIVGHYERTSGGCDTIPKSHGGTEEVFAIASRYAGRALNVFLEGNELVGSTGNLSVWRGGTLCTFCS